MISLPEFSSKTDQNDWCLLNFSGVVWTENSRCVFSDLNLIFKSSSDKVWKRPQSQSRIRAWDGGRNLLPHNEIVTSELVQGLVIIMIMILMMMIMIMIKI